MIAMSLVCELAAWLLLCGVLACLIRKVFTMSASLDRLAAAVTANTAAVNALPAQTPPVATPEQLDALSAELEANNAKIAALSTPATA